MAISDVKEMGYTPKEVSMESEEKAEDCTPFFSEHSDSSDEGDNQVVCIGCGSRTVQLVSMTKKALGEAFIGEALFGTAYGMAAGQKSIAVNTCMQCGAQWIPGSSNRLDIERKNKEKIRRESNEGCNKGCLYLFLGFLVLLIIGWLTGE